MDRIPVHLPGLGKLSPPRIKTSVFHASTDVNIDCETVRLNDKRLHSLLPSLRRGEVVLQAFRICYRGINDDNVSRCTRGASLRLHLQGAHKEYDIQAHENEFTAVRCGKTTPTRWQMGKGIPPEASTNKKAEFGHVRLLEATPNASNGKLQWAENRRNLTLSPLVSLQPFTGWKMFALTEVQATPGSSELMSLKEGGTITVLTPDGLLSMTVPPNSLTNWPQTKAMFSVTMDTSVMEFEDQNGQMGLTSPVIECQPSGVFFNESSPVSVVVPLPVYATVLEQCPDHVPEVWVSDDSNSAWHPLLDLHGHTVHPIITEAGKGRYQATFATPHFTKFVVLFRNRVADLLGMVSLYKYLTATMISQISKLMDMPDKDGRQMFTIRLDFLINNANTVTNEEFRHLAPYSSPIRLPYGDILVSLDSSLIQPAASHQFERQLGFYDDNPCCVQFECQSADGSEDMITPEMILAAVRVSRQRGNGIFFNDPIALKKTRCDDEWDSFRRTVNTKEIADIIQQEGALKVFKRLCKSRLSLHDLESTETDNPFSQEDNDFVGAVARLFEQQGGTPEQFSKALIENLQNEKINTKLDPSGNGSETTESCSSSDTFDSDEPLQLPTAYSYATAVVNDESTGPVSHSPFDKSAYHHIRVSTHASDNVESRQLSGSIDPKSMPDHQRKKKDEVTRENRRGGKRENMPHSRSLSPAPKIAPVQQPLDRPFCIQQGIRRRFKEVRRECWTPPADWSRSPYLVPPPSRPYSHGPYPECPATGQDHILPDIKITKNPKIELRRKQQKPLSFPPLGSKKRVNQSPPHCTVELPGAVNTDAWDGLKEQADGPERQGHTMHTSQLSKTDQPSKRISDHGETTFLARGKYVMSGINQRQSVTSKTRYTTNNIYVLNQYCENDAHRHRIIEDETIF